ncbi:MAG: hypothetical protein QME51_08630 [Planctomycetota bacterium]|nr:hypothetical protein [Planctomycetota bacterium]
MKSQIFHTNLYKRIEANILKLINSQPDFLSARTLSSPRAVGDAVQMILSDNFRSILGDVCKDYNSDFARRAMADLAFTDKDGLYYSVDVKTHRLDTKFNMPNLTSVERLARFYEDDKNHFIVLMVAYLIQGTKIKVQKVHFVPIEFLSWDCLTVGALGWGQIQIANANVININEEYSRKKWMLELCDVMMDFYPAEIDKIKERIIYFKKLKQRWENK